MKLVFPLVFLVSVSGFSQKLENLNAIAQGDRIVITYDINGTLAGDKCDVQIYSSHNNFSTPLQRISGDVGNGLSPGTGKKIEWEAKAELGNYKGDLSFEIRAEVKAVLAFTDAISNTKRGKSLTLAWRGGAKNQEVKMELLKAGVIQGSVATTNNNGNYQWTVPAKQRTGGGYQIRLVNGTEVITTGSFSIKHKIPTFLKILPLMAAGAAVVLLGGSGGPGKKTSNLAEPPDLGLN